MQNSDFVHLHLHSEYSLLDGALRISDIPRLAKEAGHTAVALTDHGVMYGAVAFYNACKKADIKPIIGCEVYVAPSSRFLKTQDKNNQYHHMVLLCENEIGYKNLIAMVSKSFTEGFYTKPRIDLELLRAHHEGLICLSACLGGYIPTMIARGDYDAARDYAVMLDGLFGRDNFYLELQDHGIDRQAYVNRGILHIAEETGIPLVATNDVHYARRTDAYTQAILMCIQTNTTVLDGRPKGFEEDEFFYKSTEEMARIFASCPEAVTNTKKIADRCNFAFCFDRLYLPKYEIPTKETPDAYLRRLTEEGLLQRIARGDTIFTEEHPEKEYRERIDYELSVISKMGYSEYYLIVIDFIRFAKNQGIPVGPGRGSGAGSLVAFCIGITDVDSIRYSLMFERFLNPERISMPDFDIDFCDTRRGEVIDYVKRRYGDDHVAQIVTFGTLAARAAVRDVGRALDMPYAEVDRVAKAIPRALDVTLADAKTHGELKAMYEGEAEVRRLIDIAEAIEGMPRHASTHAAGVVVTDKPVSEYVPLAENGGMTVTQFDMNTVAALGLLKIDFLGLRYLTVIHDAEAQIREHANPDFNIYAIPLDDRATFDMITGGKTAGLFQLESGGMRQVLMRLAPDNLEMIVAAISLYRPGPMDSIPRFIENRLHPEKITYEIPQLAPILDVTFGCIVYQEQVMQICRAVAGYSYARADLVRRAMSKKKQDVMEKEREIFLYGSKNDKDEVDVPGAIALGIDIGAAERLFDDMASFAKYAFNKSHSTAYAYTTYRTAYLKCHYPGEYFAALLSSVASSTEKNAEYVADAARMGIPVLAPDINESAVDFHVAETGGKTAIRFGLGAVKNVGVHFVSAIMEERKERPFADFEDFARRMSMRECPKRAIESLIKCGAFDALPQTRRQLLACYERIVDNYVSRAKTTVTGQLDLFSSPQIGGDTPSVLAGFRYPILPPFTVREILTMEREVTGQYFSGHLLDDYGAHVAHLNPIAIEDLISAFAKEDMQEGTEIAFEENPYKDKQTVTVAGVIASKFIKYTKKGDAMAFLSLEDRYASMEIIVFPKLYEQYLPLLSPDTAVAVIGELSVREDEAPKVLARALLPLKTDDELAKAKVLGLDNEVSFSAPSVQSMPRTTYPSEMPSVPPPAPAYVPKAPASTAKPLGSRASAPRSDTPIPPSPKALYLRVPSMDEDCRAFAKADNLAEIFTGNVPLVYYNTQSGKYLKKSTGVTLTPTVLYTFEALLGKENVILK